MEVQGLDGKIYKWHLDKYRNPSKRCSKLHLRARNLLRNLFPYDVIYEEALLPGSEQYRQNKPLRADFYINPERLLIEVQGEQHYEYVRHYHKSKLGYMYANLRDKNKLTWCDVNRITLIYFRYDETNKEWENKIRGR